MLPCGLPDWMVCAGRRVFVWLAFTLIALYGFGQNSAIVLKPSTAVIQFDGRLDEAEWAGAPRVVLTQQSPKPGAETPYRTEVFILATNDALYFGFHCVDPDPKRTAVHTMRRA